MDRTRRTRTCTTLIIGLCALSASVSGAGTEGSVERAAARLMLSHMDYSFPDVQQCGEHSPISARDFLADTLILLSEHPAGDARVTVRCDALQVSDDLRSFYGSELYPDVAARQLGQLKDGTPIHQCTVTMSNKQQEYAWVRGIQALIDGPGDRLVEGTLRCLLTP